MDAGRDRERLVGRLPDGGRLRRRWPTLALSVLAGGIVLAVALVVFPYHSSNHDEAVYLQQAAMLLEGQFRLYPPVTEAFRPWFFVDGPEGLYPKYAPVPAAVFALGLALGEPRVSLALVAAGNAALVTTIARRAFDRRTGLVAGGLLLTAPLFVVTSSVFLPYAPTFLANLAFAYAYVRTCRDESVRWAAAAGLASGVAFFARPYTAVLFAVPFGVHALWVLTTHRRAVLAQYAALVGAGLGMVGITFGYNALLTGSPLVFPYQAFAPHDGLGFGTRRILGHTMEYTPRRALRVNAYAVWYLATRWGPLGIVGSGLALGGFGLAHFAPERASGAWLSDRQLRLVIAGVFASVVVGNLYFWGNANVLGAATDPRNGLVGGYGPFYHFDTLLPLTTFAGYAVVRVANALGTWTASLSSGQRRAVAAVLLLVVTPVAGVAVTDTFVPPLERNAAYTDTYEQAYEPFEPQPPDDAVVLLPTPYGAWLNHPFQVLRNDPGYDGRTVYALTLDAETTWRVLDSFPDRTPYRYRYRGRWTPGPADPVEPRLQATERVRTDELAGRTTVGVPEGATSATVSLSTNGATTRSTATPRGETLVVPWTLTADRLSTTNASVPIEGPTHAEISIVVVGPRGGTFVYEQDLLVRPSGDEVDVLWPAETQFCLAATTCDDAYVPESGYPSFVEVETERR